MRLREAGTGEQAGDDRQFVTALSRGFAVLQAFTARDVLLGNQELAARTGLPKATVSRLTFTLTELGYLAYVPRFAKYRLGAPLVSLGQLALGSLGIRQVAQPRMRELAAATEATVSLGTRHRLSMVYVEHCAPRTPVALQLGIGSRIPLAVTAMGRAYFAACPDAERAAIERDIRARLPDTAAALLIGLHEAAEMHAALGFAVSIGDWNNGVHAAGAAIDLPDGSVMALNCGAPAFLLSRERVLQQAGPRVAELARQLRREF